MMHNLIIFLLAGQLIFTFFSIQTELTRLQSDVSKLKSSVSINEHSLGVVQRTLSSLQNSQALLSEKIEHVQYLKDDEGSHKVERKSQYHDDSRKTIKFDRNLKKIDIIGDSQGMIENDAKDFFLGSSSFDETLDEPSQKKLSYNREKEVSRKLEIKQIQLDETNDGKYPFTVEINYDKDYLETKWELVCDETNEQIFEESIVTVNNFSFYTFSNFIEAGSYTFSIFDSYGDGIRCESAKNVGCYRVYVVNEKMEGVNFSTQASQSFSISEDTLCIGKLFQLEIDFDKGNIETNVELFNKEMNAILYHERITDEKKNVTACVPPGYYTLSILDSGGNILEYDENSGDNHSFRIFIDEKELMIQRTDSAVTVDFFVTIDGNAHSPKCEQFPILSPINHLNRDRYEERIELLLNTIYGLTSLQNLNDRNTPQYRAACFILFDDVRNMSIVDRGLIERYSLSVFLYATNQLPEVHLSHDTCKSFDVVCNDAGSIIELNLPFRGTTGYLSTDLAHLRFLEKINLSTNKFTGTIPTELGNLFFLKDLDVSGNMFEGTIPTEIGKLNELQRLNLRRNLNITGTIPTELGKCKSLKNFALESSRVEGTIPPQLFDATKLEWLFLLDNKLIGTIPSNLGQLQNLVTFVVATNKLSGSIPREISNLNSVVNIWLQNNILSGTIPRGIGHCHQIMELIIKDNQLTGTIPDVFDNLTSLRWLDAANNHLTGYIPDSLWDNNFTASFERYNPLKGEAPDNSLWNEDDKAILNLAGNDLRGDVPDYFCAKMNELFLDTDEWFRDYPKVSCNCCKSTKKCFLWNSDNELTACSYDRSFEFSRLIGILDTFTNQTITERGSTQAKVTTCLSPTGCYKVSRQNETDLLIGYSNTTSHNELVEERCDAVNVCGQTIQSSHPKRIGLNHLMQTIVPGVHVLDDPESPHYKALCWIVNEDKIFHEVEVCDGSLIQRYALILSFYSQEKYSNRPEFFANLTKHMTCDWDFLTCDEAWNRFVVRIELMNQDFNKLNPEIGRLHRLEVFNASRNKFNEIIDPSTFKSLPNLKSLDLSNNSIIGEIPQSLLELRNLRSIHLSDNKLIGEIPGNFSFPENLESISIGNNLLQGSIPHGLTSCLKLQHVDLSQNNFQGTIPTEFGKMEDLRTIKLYENGFTGNIPTEIFQPINIESIMLQSNSLTGSIPSEIGNLTKLVSVALNHNRLKGNIPTLGVLRNVEFLHFHHNQLTGTAPEISKESFLNNTIRNYITDCGIPYYALPSDLTCRTCTMCCNSDERCQQVQEWKLSITAAGMLISVLVPSILVFFCIWRTCIFRCAFPRQNNHQRHLIAKRSSVYQFAMSSDKRAQAIFTFTGIMQFLLYFSYLGPSELKSEDTDFQFSFICPNNDNDCINMNSVTSAGWILFVFVTFTYIGSDFVQGYYEISNAVYDKDIRLLLSGFMILFISTLAFFTSVVYNIALAESNTDLIMNAVILLFINDVDEKVALMMESIAPEWTFSINEEIEAKRMLTHS